MPAEVETFEGQMQLGGDRAVRTLGQFFIGEDPVHKTMHAIAKRLDALQIPYAVVGGMALAAHGFVRGTTDVDLLVTVENLKRVHDELEGFSYIPPFTGSRIFGMRTATLKLNFL